MIRKVHIQNFRGFQDMNVEGLQAVNILTGSNGSGKTSFLEALFMCAGSSALANWFKLRTFRQIGNRIQTPADVASYEAIWEDMFFDMDPKRIIEIDAAGDAEDSRRVRIYNEHRTQKTEVLFADSPAISSNNPQIVSEWQKNDSPPIVVRPKINGQGLAIENTVFDLFPIIMFGPHIADPAEDNARRFSQLSREGKLESIERALCDEFPFVEGLSLEFNANGPAVFAKLKDQTTKLPLGVVSDGINKLFSLLLGIASSKDGVVLIDQIEDGFYYKRFESLWRIIYRVTKENNCQLFITSHNKELLQALTPTILGNEGDFTMLHSDRTRGLIQFHAVQGKYFAATIEQGLEIR